MPTSNAALSARAEFDKATAALAPAVTKELAPLVAKRLGLPWPSGEQPAGATDDTQSQPTAQSEHQPADSPAADTAQGDVENVDDSSAATDEADASDDSDPADLTSETADQQLPRAKGRAQVRIEDLVASNKALKASLDYLQNEVLAKLPQPQAQQPTAQTPAAPAATEEAPTLESCGFDTDKWTRAMHAWTAKQIEQGVTKAVRTVQQNQTEATRRATFETRMASFQAATPDLQVVLGNPALPQLHKDAASLVVDSAVGPQILYHLGKNPEKAARIARQNPVQQAAAIGRLEAELSTRPAQQKKPTPNVTRAPAPPTPTNGGGAAQTDMAKAPIADFVAHERARLAEKRHNRR